LAAAAWDFPADVADRVTATQAAIANPTAAQFRQQSFDSLTHVLPANLVSPEMITRLSTDEVGNEKQDLVDYNELELI
jgi:hypothetical protein